MSLWVYYALMTSVMAEQIISGSSPSLPSLSFAPWGNPGSSRMFYGSGKRWSHRVLMKGRQMSHSFEGSLRLTALPSVPVWAGSSEALTSTSSLNTVSLENSLGKSSAVAEQEMMGQTCFLWGLKWQELSVGSGTHSRKLDRSYQPWWLGLAAEAGPVLYFHFLEIKALCGFCWSVRDQAQVLLNRVSSSYFKQPGLWQRAA